MLKEIDYEVLIDPLCIPVIKLMREKFQIETLFCCQGQTLTNRKSGKFFHSLCGYITAVSTPVSDMVFERLANIAKAYFMKYLYDKVPNRLKLHYPERVKPYVIPNWHKDIYEGVERVSFHLFDSTWVSDEVIKEIWDILTDYLEKLSKDENIEKVLILNNIAESISNNSKMKEVK